MTHAFVHCKDEEISLQFKSCFCPGQVLALVASSAAFIRSAHGWKTVCALITATSINPEAAPTSLNALASVARSQALSTVSFLPVMDAIVACVERYALVCSRPLCSCDVCISHV